MHTSTAVQTKVAVAKNKFQSHREWILKKTFDAFKEKTVNHLVTLNKEVKLVQTKLQERDATIKKLEYMIQGLPCQLQRMKTT